MEPILLLLAVLIGLAAWLVLVRKRRNALPPKQKRESATSKPAPQMLPEPAPLFPGMARLSARDILNSPVNNAARDIININWRNAPTPRSANCTLPSRKLFVGRQALLAELEARLQKAGTVGVTSLKGVPGVGKSALALEASYLFSQFFPGGQHWLDLRGEASAALRELLIKLGAIEPQEQSGPLAAMCAMLHAQLAGQRVLLVLDNAEKLARRDRAQLDALCLPAPAVTLITSRVALTGNDLRVDVLSEEDALALLDNLGLEIKGQRAEAVALSKRLGGLALALNITARRMRINKTPQSCAQALAYLAQGRSVVAQLKLPRQNTVDDNVAESFALSYALLDRELQAAFHALGLCAASGAPITGLARLLETSEAEAEEQALARLAFRWPR